MFDAANLDVYSRMSNVLLNFYPDVRVRVTCHSFDPFKAKVPSPIAQTVAGGVWPVGERKETSIISCNEL